VLLNTESYRQVMIFSTPCVCFLVLYASSISCILFFCVVFCIVSPFFIYSCLFSIFVLVYRLLPPGGNPIAVNRYHINSIPTLEKVTTVGRWLEIFYSVASLNTK
jgi:hypothetical protein